MTVNQNASKPSSRANCRTGYLSQDRARSSFHPMPKQPQTQQALKEQKWLDYIEPQ